MSNEKDRAFKSSYEELEAGNERLRHRVEELERRVERLVWYGTWKERGDGRSGKRRRSRGVSRKRTQSGQVVRRDTRRRIGSARGVQVRTIIVSIAQTCHWQEKDFIVEVKDVLRSLRVLVLPLAGAAPSDT